MNNSIPLGRRQLIWLPSPSSIWKRSSKPQSVSVTSWFILLSGRIRFHRLDPMVPR